MKEFRYASGNVAGQTYTVKELKEELSKYPDHLPVFGYNEGCHCYIRPYSFLTQTVHKGKKEDETTCLLIEIEDY